MIKWGVVTPTVGKGAVAKATVSQHELNCCFECILIGNIHDICVESAAQRTRTIICTFAFKGDFLPCGWQFFCHGALCSARRDAHGPVPPRRRSSSTGLDVDHAYAETATIGANCFFAASSVELPHTPNPNSSLDVASSPQHPDSRIRRRPFNADPA